MARIEVKRFIQNLVENMKERDCPEDLGLIGKQTLQQIFIKFANWCVLNSSGSRQIPLMIRPSTGTELLAALQTRRNSEPAEAVISCEILYFPPTTGQVFTSLGCYAAYFGSWIMAKYTRVKPPKTNP